MKLPTGVACPRRATWRSRKAAVVLALLPCLGAKSFAWDHAINSSDEGTFWMIGFGVTVGGISSALGVYQLEKETGEPISDMLLVGTVLGFSVTTPLVQISRKSTKTKALVFHLKVDHDLYLAGGEMTPFLQGVYREIRARTHGFDAEGGGIDEAKMAGAVDGLVAWAEAVTEP